MTLVLFCIRGVKHEAQGPELALYLELIGQLVARFRDRILMLSCCKSSHWSMSVPKHLSIQKVFVLVLSKLTR